MVVVIHSNICIFSHIFIWWCIVSNYIFTRTLWYDSIVVNTKRFSGATMWGEGSVPHKWVLRILFKCIFTPCVQCACMSQPFQWYANHVVARIRMIIIFRFHWSHMNFSCVWPYCLRSKKPLNHVANTEYLFIEPKIWAKHSNAKCAIFYLLFGDSITKSPRQKATQFAQFQLCIFYTVTDTTSIFEMLCVVFHQTMMCTWWKWSDSV